MPGAEGGIGPEVEVVVAFGNSDGITQGTAIGLYGDPVPPGFADGERRIGGAIRPTASQASLVSVQATSATSAEVIVKGIRLSESGWKLTATSATGNLSLTPGAPRSLGTFDLTTSRLNGLVTGQTYQLRLAFRFAERDSLVAVRIYTHRPDTSPRWTRLAHASFSGGDYTGYPVAMNGICDPNPNNGCGHPGIGAYVGKEVQILRYPGNQSGPMDLRYYDRASDS